MLKNRALTPNDINEVRRLHELHYSDFDFPKFEELICGFVIEDEKNEIVMAGGVEAIGEALLVTNKEKSRIKIGKGLVLAQNISNYICWKANIRELHAFVTDDNYAQHLIQHGFEPRNEKVLRMRIPNG